MGNPEGLKHLKSCENVFEVSNDVAELWRVSSKTKSYPESTQQKAMPFDWLMFGFWKQVLCNITVIKKYEFKLFNLMNKSIFPQKA